MENRRTRNILISCGVILIVACLCLGILIISGVGVSLIWPLRFGQESSAVTTTQDQSSPDETITEEPVELEDDPPDEDTIELPKELSDILYQIESEVTQIRGLTPTEPVDRTLISTEELEQIVAEDFFAEYTDQDVQQDVLILSLLGLLPDDFDLKGFYEELYTEQIAGFYDDEIEEIYVVQGEDFGGSEKLTYSHEFTHVLQDQVYDLDQGLGLNDEDCEADSEKCAAVQSLIEGDASYTEILWFQTYATREDYLDLMETYEDFTSPVLDSAPPYMAADLYFPYENGMAFVEILYEQGGYEAVDAAYVDLPVSTEQILHPEKYPDDRPITVTLPELETVLGENWTLIDQNVMGEWYTYLILNKAYDESHRLSDRTADAAAAGWGGDAYGFYLNDETQEAVFIMDAVWDSINDAEEFAEAFEDYADLRWDPSENRIKGYPAWLDGDLAIVLTLDGNRTTWVMGPSGNIVQDLLDALE